MALLFLDREEIAEMTGRVQYAAQRKVLNHMGIQHKQRPDGSLAILRAHVEELFGLKRKPKLAAEVEPNWAACDEPNRDAFKDLPKRTRTGAIAKNNK